MARSADGSLGAQLRWSPWPLGRSLATERRRSVRSLTPPRSHSRPPAYAPSLLPLRNGIASDRIRARNFEKLRHRKDLRQLVGLALLEMRDEIRDERFRRTESNRLDLGPNPGGAERACKLLEVLCDGVFWACAALLVARTEVERILVGCTDLVFEETPICPLGIGALVAGYKGVVKVCCQDKGWDTTFPDDVIAEPEAFALSEEGLDKIDCVGISAGH